MKRHNRSLFPTCMAALVATGILATESRAADQLRVVECVANRSSVQGAPSVYRLLVTNTSQENVIIRLPLRVDDGVGDEKRVRFGARPCDDTLERLTIAHYEEVLEPGESWLYSADIPAEPHTYLVSPGKYVMSVRLCTYTQAQRDQMVELLEERAFRKISADLEALGWERSREQVVAQAKSSATHRFVGNPDSPCEEFGWPLMEVRHEYEVRAPEGVDRWYFDRYLAPLIPEGTCREYNTMRWQLGEDTRGEAEPALKARILSTTYFAQTRSASWLLRSPIAPPPNAKQLLELPSPDCYDKQREAMLAAGYGWDNLLLCGLGQEVEPNERFGLSVATLERIASDSPDCVTAELARRVLAGLEESGQ